MITLLSGAIVHPPPATRDDMMTPAWSKYLPDLPSKNLYIFKKKSYMSYTVKVVETCKRNLTFSLLSNKYFLWNISVIWKPIPSTYRNILLLLTKGVLFEI